MLIPAEDFDRRPGNRVAPDVRDERQFFSRRLAVAALTLAAALVLIVPWQGGSARINRHLPPATGALNYSEGAFRLLQHGDWWRLEPDYSYAEVFHWAFLHPHSERLISTYGPWGFLLIGFSAATFWWVIAAWIFLVFVWSSLLWSLGERYLPPLALLFWMLATSVVLVPIPREELLLLLPVAFLLTYFSCAEGAAKYCLIAGGAAMALGALIKSSSLVISVLVVAVVTADDLLRRRRVPSAAISFTLSLLFFWLLAGRPLGELPMFFRTTTSVITAYADAVSLPVADSFYPPVLFALMGGAILAVVAIVEWPEGKLRWMYLMSGLGAALLSLFKAGCMRNDLYHDGPKIALAAVALLVLPLIVGRASVRLQRLAACGALTATTIFVLMLPDAQHPFAEAAGLRSLPDARRRIVQQVYSDWQAVKETHPLPDLKESIDVYPHRQALVLAAGLNYHPRPVFQSYIANTAALAELNAAHLRSTLAPDWILFEVWPIDRRYPSLDDGRSWPELLTRYQLYDRTSGVLLLRKRQTPGTWKLIPLKTAQVRFGQRLTVPSAGDRLIWAEVDVRKSFSGRIRSMLYRLPRMFVDVELSGGAGFRGRLVADMARGGFLLSPLVVDTQSFASLYPDTSPTPLDGRRVEQMILRTEDPSVWEQPATVKFFELEIGR